MHKISSKTTTKHQRYRTMMITSAGLLLAASCCYTTSPTVAFQLPSIGFFPIIRTARNTKIMIALSSSTTANDGASSSTTKTSSANENTSKSYLYVPSERDEHYEGNVAQYLLDLNDEVRSLRILCLL